MAHTDILAKSPIEQNWRPREWLKESFIEQVLWTFQQGFEVTFST